MRNRQRLYWFILIAFAVVLAVWLTWMTAGCRWRAAGLDLSKQSETTVAPVTTQTQESANDQDPTMIAYGDLKNWMQNTIRNTQNDLWPSVVTNGIQTVCVLLAVRWWIKRHSYREQKPQYELERMRDAAAIREAAQAAEVLREMNG